VAGPGEAGVETKVHLEGRTIGLGEESLWYLLPGLVRTDAPCGQTPIRRAVYTREHVSMMRGITIDRRLDILVRDDALDRLDRVLCLTAPHVVEMWHLCCMNLMHLRCELSLAIKRLRRKLHVMTACVAEARCFPESETPRMVRFHSNPRTDILLALPRQDDLIRTPTQP
jgi:hypothetical protein